MALSNELVLDVCMELNSPAGVRLRLECPELELPDPLEVVAPVLPVAPEPEPPAALPDVAEDVDPAVVAMGMPLPPFMLEAKFCALAKSPFRSAAPS